MGAKRKKKRNAGKGTSPSKAVVASEAGAHTGQPVAKRVEHQPEEAVAHTDSDVSSSHSVTIIHTNPFDMDDDASMASGPIQASVPEPDPQHTSSEAPPGSSFRRCSDASLQVADGDDLVVVLDRIDREQFSHPRKVLKEIHRLKSNVVVHKVVMLARGGVAVTVRSRNHYLALLSWPEGSFGVQALHAHPPKHGFAGCAVGVVRVDVSESDQDMFEGFSEQNPEVRIQRLHRLHNRSTKTPLRAVKVFFAKSHHLESALSHGLRYGTVVHRVERARSERSLRVTRCYRCQRFGHIAQFCSQPVRCATCGGAHQSSNDHPCHKSPSCANCGQSHPAYASTCPVYSRRIGRPVSALRVSSPVMRSEPRAPPRQYSIHRPPPELTAPSPPPLFHYPRPRIAPRPSPAPPAPPAPTSLQTTLQSLVSQLTALVGNAHHRPQSVVRQLIPALQDLCRVLSSDTRAWTQ